MKNKCLFLAVAFLTILLSSCSNDLSRADAEKLIKGKYNYPEIQTSEIGGRINREYYGGEVMAGFNYINAKGLISMVETRETFNSGAVYDCYRVSLTEEGKKYLISEAKDDSGVNIYTVKTSEIVFGEITGLQINDKVAMVNYTLKQTNFTPFIQNATEEVINRTATFSLFDDGWRITQ